MTFILAKELKEIPLPFVLVAEGMGDVRFLDRLLQAVNIDVCNVGCPSSDSAGGQGKDKYPEYLAAIQAAIQLKKAPALKGILVFVDADTNPDQAFDHVRTALQKAELPVPTKPFSIEEGGALRVAVFLIPGEKKEGALEHLLLQAAFTKNPKLRECVDKFTECTGAITSATLNQKAKMTLSALVGACCKDNPWASVALIWSDKGNPVPIESECYKPIIDFIAEFIQEKEE